MEKEKWKNGRDCISAYEKHSVNYEWFQENVVCIWRDISNSKLWCAKYGGLT